MRPSTFPPTFFIIGRSSQHRQNGTSMGIISNLLSPELGLQYGRHRLHHPVGQQTSRIREHHRHMVEVDKEFLCSPSYISSTVQTTGR